MQPTKELIDDIYRAIEPIDVAGVCDRNRRNWHPVAARDLLNGAGKLGVTESDIAQLLARCGFFPPAVFRRLAGPEAMR